jgi:hypothetical protein
MALGEVTSIVGPGRWGCDGVSWVHGGVAGGAGIEVTPELGKWPSVIGIPVLTGERESLKVGRPGFWIAVGSLAVVIHVWILASRPMVLRGPIGLRIAVLFVKLTRHVVRADVVLRVLAKEVCTIT